MFQLFAFEVYDDLISLMEKVRPTLAEKLPRNKEALLTTTSVTQGMRILRDAFEHVPQDAEKVLAELQRARAPSVEVRKRQMLTSLIRMYQSGKSQHQPC